MDFIINNRINSRSILPLGSQVTILCTLYSVKLQKKIYILIILSIIQALAKCEKRRVKAAEAWMRGAHAARQEQAAQRREEKRKLEKEKILAVYFFLFCQLLVFFSDIARV